MIKKIIILQNISTEEIYFRFANLDLNDKFVKPK